MIIRDLVRLMLNVVVGPFVGFLFFLAAFWVLLVLPLEGGGELASRMDSAGVMLVFAAPFFMIAHLFGALPGIINAAMGSLLDRLLRFSRALRILLSLGTGALATWLGDFWLFTSTYEINVGSRLTFNVAVVVGGVFASLVVALVLDLLGPKIAPRPVAAA